MSCDAEKALMEPVALLPRQTVACLGGKSEASPEAKVWGAKVKLPRRQSLRKNVKVIENVVISLLPQRPSDWPQAGG
jgi:hypothetical protein